METKNSNGRNKSLAKRHLSSRTKWKDNVKSVVYLCILFSLEIAFQSSYGLSILYSDNNKVDYEYVSWMELAQNCVQCRIWY
jgi:hypothetical protein